LSTRGLSVLVRLRDEETLSLLLPSFPLRQLASEQAFILVMANQHIGDNPFNDATRDREAPTRAEFQTLQQSILQLREAMERLQAGFNQPPQDRDALEDDGIRVRAVYHPCLAPINQPQVFDNNSSDEHADKVYGRNYGVE
jgi:hypothetical protein